ncbi:MAG: 4a-hydroxytetrahydrobiopterin dehydratase [Phycisphaerae bacterium]|nr:4a-hydroxytetrahydrobiopterin dehydratase [Phycisphaerae bacterium]
MGLADQKCVPCKGGVAPLKGDELRAYHEQVPTWELVNEHHLAKTWKFTNFAKALEFVNRVGALAEQEGHHPWIHFTWGIVRIELWTHKIDGLCESDFILAAKIDGL